MLRVVLYNFEWQLLSDDGRWDSSCLQASKISVKSLIVQCLVCAGLSAAVAGGGIKVGRRSPGSSEPAVGLRC